MGPSVRTGRVLRAPVRTAEESGQDALDLVPHAARQFDAGGAGGGVRSHDRDPLGVATADLGQLVRAVGALERADQPAPVHLAVLVDVTHEDAEQFDTLRVPPGVVVQGVAPAGVAVGPGDRLVPDDDLRVVDGRDLVGAATVGRDGRRCVAGGLQVLGHEPVQGRVLRALEVRTVSLPGALRVQVGLLLV